MTDASGPGGPSDSNRGDAGDGAGWAGAQDGAQDGGGWTPDPFDSPPSGDPAGGDLAGFAADPWAGPSSRGNGQATAAAPGGGDGERPLMYSNVDDWLREYLAPHIRRRLGGQSAWCPHWWAHEEAISVLTALWSAWEQLRYDGALGLINWWLQYCYPALDRLTSPDAGPFASCRKEHVQLKPLPCAPAPPELRTNPAYADPAATTPAHPSVSMFEQ